MSTTPEIIEHAYKKPHCPVCNSLNVKTLGVQNWNPWEPPGLGGWESSRTTWIEENSELHQAIKKKWCDDCDWTGTVFDWEIYDPAADRETLFEQRGWQLVNQSPRDYDEEPEEYWALHAASHSVVGPYKCQSDAVQDVVVNHLELVGTAQPS